MCYSGNYSTLSLEVQGDFVTMLSNGSLWTAQNMNYIIAR